MLDTAAQQYAGRSLGLTGKDLTEVLDPRRIVATRTAAGGAAPEVVSEMAASCGAQAADLLAAARAARTSYAEAQRTLLRTAASLSGGSPPDSDDEGRAG
jgi:argininosuccinate lyase